MYASANETIAPTTAIKAHIRIQKKTVNPSTFQRPITSLVAKINDAIKPNMRTQVKPVIPSK